jgi:hypothetical protein
VKNPNPSLKMKICYSIRKGSLCGILFKQPKWLSGDRAKTEGGMWGEGYSNIGALVTAN